MQGTDLVVKLDGMQIMTVNEDFQSGQMGIRLIDQAAHPDGTAPTIDFGSNGFPTVFRGSLYARPRHRADPLAWDRSERVTRCLGWMVPEFFLPAYHGV
jgi:hypothetical protein